MSKPESPRFSRKDLLMGGTFSGKRAGLLAGASGFYSVVFTPRNADRNQLLNPKTLASEAIRNSKWNSLLSGIATAIYLFTPDRIGSKSKEVMSRRDVLRNARKVAEFAGASALYAGSTTLGMGAYGWADKHVIQPTIDNIHLDSPETDFQPAQNAARTDASDQNSEEHVFYSKVVNWS